MLTDEELREIEARAELATEGPWLDPWQGGPGQDESICNTQGVSVVHATIYDAKGYLAVRKKDAAFITHAREDVPKLLQEVKRLKAELSQRQSYIDKLIDFIWDLTGVLREWPGGHGLWAKAMKLCRAWYEHAEDGWDLPTGKE